MLAASAAGCLLYTNPINMAPELSKVTGPDRLVRGQAATFKVTPTDPDQDAATLALQWRKAAGACPMTIEEAGRRGSAGSVKPEYDVTPDSLDPFCVWVVVTDEHGAQAFASRVAQAANQRPVAKLQVVATAPSGSALKPAATGPYELYSKFRVSAAGSDDSDAADKGKLAPRFTNAGPAGPIKTERCPELQDARDICFAADVPGTYRVELVVGDGIDDSEPKVETLVVNPDRPPCIEMGSIMPRLLGEGGLRRGYDEAVVFEVGRVTDDGDPFAGGLGQNFTWYYREGRATQAPFNRVPGLRDYRWTVRANYFRPGTTVQVRVEYRDRVDRNDRLAACGATDAALCKVDSQLDCAQAVTWTVEYY